MPREIKRLSRGLEIKDEAAGTVEAVFSTIGVRDHDWDVTRAGAFDSGAPVIIGAYAHGSWGGALPPGKGIIKVSGNEAVLEGQFFLSTTHGRDTFETVKSLGESGLGEWSYGFEAVEYSFGEHEGERVRFLDKVKVFEISPVMQGAGIGTRTLGAKSLRDEIQEAADAVSAAVDSASRVVALRAEHGQKLSRVNRESIDVLIDRLADLKARLTAQDSDTDSSQLVELMDIAMRLEA